MKIEIVTLFAQMVDEALSHSIVGRARKNGLMQVNTVDLRQYCHDKHRHADDEPYGGGGGMVLKVEPIVEAVQACKERLPGAKVVFLGPQGRRLDHAAVMEYAARTELILLCGHYEGVDQRALDAVVDETLSIGDYVLTGGELPACVLVDAVTRQQPGALGDEDSAKNESFVDGLLDYPHYTRPAETLGRAVPAALQNGNHAEIARWRREAALEATFKLRPDLLEQAPLTQADAEFLTALGWHTKKKQE
jgi:tRNA (guanine37-N1)-methyltransferase